MLKHNEEASEICRHIWYLLTNRLQMVGMRVE